MEAAKAHYKQLKSSNADAALVKAAKAAYKAFKASETIGTKRARVEEQSVQSSRSRRCVAKENVFEIKNDSHVSIEN